jgi:hypothetical protein
VTSDRTSLHLGRREEDDACVPPSRLERSQGDEHSCRRPRQPADLQAPEVSARLAEFGGAPESHDVPADVEADIAEADAAAG